MIIFLGIFYLNTIALVFFGKQKDFREVTHLMVCDSELCLSLMIVSCVSTYVKHLQDTKCLNCLMMMN